MIRIPTDYSDTTKEIIQELDTFTFDEKSAVIKLVQIMADYPGNPEEVLSRITDKAKSIFSRFNGNEKELVITECLWALVQEAELKAQA